MGNEFFGPGEFADFNNVTISIVRDGGNIGKDAFGNPKRGADVVVLDEEGAQEWPLSASDKEGLSGEQINQRKNIRLNAYHPNITAKMTAIVDGVLHNIVAANHEGSKSASILTVERITPQV